MVASAPFLPGLDLDSPPSALDFARTTYIALFYLVARWVFNRTLTKPLGGFLKNIGTVADQRRAVVDVLDNAFVAIASFILEVLAVYITIFFNAHCTPWSSDPCLDEWPNQFVHPLQRAYMLLMFHFYLYEMFGPRLGFGVPLKPDMVVHHVATMTLIALAYVSGLIRYGIMWMALFDVSNPILHTAKMLHAAGAPVLEAAKWAAFFTFAATFFVARLAAPPWSILKPAFQRGFNTLPFAWAFTFVALMLLVYALQFSWFYRIVLLAVRGPATPPGSPQQRKIS
mmetsp:Transcript_5051/g.10965  ORF Transcript_5051/g.10965 Transcript_5051/m.10965 type:complete len:284 (-) Transcript_5051:702-1553(-)